MMASDSELALFSKSKSLLKSALFITDFIKDSKELESSTLTSSSSSIDLISLTSADFNFSI